MSKRVLFFGRGASGSWRIRAEQLGAAVGGAVDSTPNAYALNDVDIAVLVKRCYEPTLTLVHSRGLPIVWDVVDAWPQPVGNNWDARTAMNWLRTELAHIRPAAVVAATAKMAQDIGDVYKGPVLWLPHHARPGLTPRQVRPAMGCVGYEGAPSYLGDWLQYLKVWAGRHRMLLTVKSDMSVEEYSSMDVVVALRDFSGYPARNWKSNVKLANAQAAGIPCIAVHEQGYLETATGGERFILGPDRYELLYQALDALLPYAARVEAQQKHAANIVSLDRISRIYRTWLQSLKF